MRATMNLHLCSLNVWKNEDCNFKKSVTKQKSSPVSSPPFNSQVLGLSAFPCNVPPCYSGLEFICFRNIITVLSSLVVAFINLVLRMATVIPTTSMLEAFF
jgi:hypothetical protein